MEVFVHIRFGFHHSMHVGKINGGLLIEASRDAEVMVYDESH